MFYVLSATWAVCYVTGRTLHANLPSYSYISVLSSGKVRIVIKYCAPLRSQRRRQSQLVRSDRQVSSERPDWRLPDFVRFVENSHSSPKTYHKTEKPDNEDIPVSQS